MKTSETIIKDILKLADIEVGGSRPHDIKVSDDRFYDRVLRDQQLGLGESYMEGWWSAKKVDETILHILNGDLQNKIKPSPQLVLAAIRSKVSATALNQQSIARARDNAIHHYDIGNDLYERMLGKSMVYTCAYWKDAKNLDDAQIAKLDLVCRKLQLKKGMTVLELGCGWGGFAEYAARKYGVTVTGVTPAAEQVKFARARTKGLKVKILQNDYREATGTYDRVVSIGILEHIGLKNYETFFKVCDERLKPGGLMLHHTIGANASYGPNGDPWVVKYIFPGGRVPALSELMTASENRFIVEDVHNIGPDYDKTLMAWHRNFTKTYGEISDKYDERFYLMWEYYLLLFAGCFRARSLELWQIVMRRPEESPAYRSVR